MSRSLGLSMVLYSHTTTTAAITTTATTSTTTAKNHYYYDKQFHLKVHIPERKDHVLEKMF